MATHAARCPTPRKPVAGCPCQAATSKRGAKASLRGEPSAWEMEARRALTGRFEQLRSDRAIGEGERWDHEPMRLRVGDGGDGVARWLHEKGKEFMGPAGGNGGRGGNGYVKAIRNTNLLSKYKSEPNLGTAFLEL